MQFTEHNIVLPDGEQARASAPPIRDAVQTRAILRTMHLAFAGRDRATVHVADLGCLEGGYSVELTRGLRDARHRRPRGELRLLWGRSTRRLLMLQTHYTTDVAPEACTLGDWTTHEGRRGRWYLELAEGGDDAELIPNRWGSLRNRGSFWLDKRELVQAIRDAGFDLAFEQYDFVDDYVNNDVIDRYSRGMFVTVRTGDPPI